MKAQMRPPAISPSEYVLEKFRCSDIVFLGENHYIKEELLFLQNLIPALSNGGIKFLGLEMASRDRQQDIDRLLDADSYDESLAIDILRHWRCDFCYQEYLDIFRVAWELNSSLRDNSRRFRIIGLDIDHGYGSKCDVSGWDMMRDSFMAETVQREIVSKNEKALVYAHLSHAVTKYVFGKKGTQSHLSLGNLIYRNIPDRCTTLYFHGHISPICDALDNFAARASSPVAFDADSAPVQSTSSNAPMSASVCDGYIVIGALRSLHPVTITEKWTTPEFLDWHKRVTGREFDLQKCQDTASGALSMWQKGGR